MENDKKFKILYLCTGNSCRSQMAEGFTRRLVKDQIDAYSAGIDPKGIDPRAIQVMAEVGIDISRQQSKSTDDIKHMEFDFVITLCDNARKTCPTFPAKTSVIHMGFDDLPRLAENSKNEEEALYHYLRVRDEIQGFVEKLPQILRQKKEDMVFDPTRFVAGLKSVLDQLPKDLTGKKPERKGKT
jgi:arsenate reductase (thioredoxin)